MFLNQRAAEFNFFTPSAPHRPIHSNLSGVEPKIRRISAIFVGVLDVESVWLQELESSMKSPRGTDEIAVHEKPGRLNRHPIGLDQVEASNRLA